MEREDVYTKTGEGHAESNERRMALPDLAYRLLAEMDGRTPLDLAQLRLEPISPADFEEALDLLLDRHLVELIDSYSGSSVLGPLSNSGLSVNLLGSDIGAQAWENAVAEQRKADGQKDH